VGACNRQTNLLEMRDCNYLIKAQELREQGRPFFYFSQTWVADSLTVRKFGMGLDFKG
jgi:hypothetical protein